MKIIKKGIDYPETVNFTCICCGCVFAAERSEYRVDFSFGDEFGLCFAIDCPHCGYGIKTLASHKDEGNTANVPLETIQDLWTAIEQRFNNIEARIPGIAMKGLLENTKQFGF